MTDKTVQIKDVNTLKVKYDILCLVYKKVQAFTVLLIEQLKDFINWNPVFHSRELKHFTKRVFFENCCSVELLQFPGTD